MLVMSRGKWDQGFTWMPPAAAQISHHVGIDDTEIETELVPHLVAPLDLQSRWTYNQDLPGAMTQDEFQRHHSGFDGFAQADIVSDEQIDSRQLHGRRWQITCRDVIHHPRTRPNLHKLSKFGKR